MIPSKKYNTKYQYTIEIDNKTRKTNDRTNEMYKKRFVFVKINFSVGSSAHDRRFITEAYIRDTIMCEVFFRFLVFDIETPPHTYTIDIVRRVSFFSVVEYCCVQWAQFLVYKKKMSYSENAILRFLYENVQQRWKLVYRYEENYTQKVNVLYTLSAQPLINILLFCLVNLAAMTIVYIHTEWVDGWRISRQLIWWIRIGIYKYGE